MSSFSLPSIDRNSIHAPFSAWLDSPKVDLEDIDGVLADIQEGLMPLFEYNVFHITDERHSIEFDESIPALIFEGIFRGASFFSPSGQCGELTNKMYFLVLKKYPELFSQLKMCGGNEALYFARRLEIEHCFLVLSEKGSLGRGWIIDPSLGVVEPFPTSRYQISGLLEPYYLPGDLQQPPYAPLSFAFTGDRQIVNVGWLPENERVTMAMSLQSPNQSLVRPILLTDDNVSRLLANEEAIAHYLLLLRDRVRFVTEV